MAGYIYRDPPINSWVAGGLTGLPKVVLQADGQWVDYLPDGEYQKKDSFDTYGCVSFSHLNGIECLEKRLTGKQQNYSDRFVVVGSGTAPGFGNDAYSVCEFIRKKGLVLEADCPWVDGQAGYYSSLNQDLYWEGEKWLMDYAFNYEQVRPEHGKYHETVKEFLRYAPLAVTVAYANGSGVLNPKGIQNHFVLLIGYREGEYWLVADHYGTWIKKYDWNYIFAFINRPHLTIKEKTMPQLENNQLYLLVEGGEQRLGMATEGKMMVADKGQETLLLLNSAGRLQGKLSNVKITGINKAGWDALTKINMKGELI